MTTKILGEESRHDTTEMLSVAWQNIYRAGAISVLVVVLAGLTDIFIMFMPGTGTSPGSRTVIDWFTLLQSQWFLALRDLGLLNMVTISCSVVVFFALFGAHRRINPLAAGLALILISIGAAIYITNNTGLPMLTLSQHYAAATSENQKSLWAIAGQALLAQEDLTAGAYPGFFVAEMAGFLMAGVALRGRVFQQWEAWIGMIGTGCLFFFNFCAAFIPTWYGSVMPVFGAAGGLLSMVWFARIAQRLFSMPLE
jgi:hypothetical protein